MTSTSKKNGKTQTPQDSSTRLLIVSGTSGSGKTVALKVLEDLGYYCIDNLPVSLLKEMTQKIQMEGRNCAVSIDCRNFDFMPNVQIHLDSLNAHNANYQVIYLDASDKTLLRRYSETRRKHPLSDKHTALLEAIKKERQQLECIANVAGHTISTSKTTPHELKETIRNLALPSKEKILVLQLQSFGFKYGNPDDADFIFDVRCLPNPYWDETLRPLTGLDPKIENYFNQNALCHEMFQHISSFINHWTPHFIQQNRHYLTIAVGCTGGKHRSVYLCNQLYYRLKTSELIQTQVRHRELNL